MGYLHVKCLSSDYLHIDVSGRDLRDVLVTYFMKGLDMIYT